MLRKKLPTYPADMDVECIPLCNALNAFPGIETILSCCGHGRAPFRIFFLAKSLRSLRPVLQPLSKSSWQVEVSWTFGGDTALFMLVSDNPSPAAIEWLIGALSDPV